MEAQTPLREIIDYCGKAGMAESAFGRLVANDYQLVDRLRAGGRIATTTLDRVRAFMTNHPVHIEDDGSSLAVDRSAPGLPSDDTGAGQRAFRFYDNRQKYLLFVNTCSEKWVTAQRIAIELAHIHPRPPAVRVFDAGVGDGTVLTRDMRASM
jgi:hypothetical protein